MFFSPRFVYICDFFFTHRPLILAGSGFLISRYLSFRFFD